MQLTTHGGRLHPFKNSCGRLVTAAGRLFPVVSLADAQVTIISPDAVAAVAAVPSPTLVRTKTLTPDAVAAPAALPSVAIYRARLLTPTAAVALAAVSAITLVLVGIITPSPAAAAASVPTPAIQRVLVLTPDPALAPAVLPSPTVVRTLTLTPGTIPAPASVPSVTLALTRTLTPSAVPAPALVPSVGVTPTGMFWRLWFGPAGAEAKMQVDANTSLLGARHPTKASYDMPAGFGSPHGSAYDPLTGKVFICTRGAPYRLIRLNPDDLDDYTYITAPTGDQWASALVIVGTRLFLNFTRSGSEHTFVDEYDTEDATPVRVAQYDLGEYGDSDSIATDGTNLFIGTTQNKVVRCAIADLPAPVVIATGILGSGSGGAHAIRYSAGKLYVGVSGHHIYRLNSTTLASEDSLDLSGIDLWITDDAALAGDYIYFGWESNGTGRILKVPKANLAGYSVLTVSRGTADNCYGVFEEPGEDYVWAVFTDNVVTQPKMPGELTRVKVSDDSFQRFWVPETQLNELVFCGSRDKIVLATYLTPTSFIRLENLITDDPVQTSVPRSYWWPIRLYAEGVQAIDDMEAYTDGAGFGANIDLKGNKATAYTEPTGTPGVGGAELTVGNYPSLAGAVVDAFTWLLASPFIIDAGPEAGPGDVGDFLVLQMLWAVGAPPGPTATEAITLTHDADAIGKSGVATLYGDYDLTLTPTAVSAPASIPSVAIKLTLKPDAVPAPAVVPSATIVSLKTLTPGAAAATAAAPSVVLVLTLKPDAVATPAIIPSVSIVSLLTLLPGVVVAPAALPPLSLKLTLKPDAVSAPAFVPAIALVLTLHPTPATAAAAIPTPVIARTKTVTPSAATVATTIPSITLVLIYTVTPSPVAAPAKVPSATLISASTTLVPDFIVAHAAVPSVSVVVGAITRTPGPVVALAAIPAVSVALGGLLTPSPVTAVAAVPSVSLLLTLKPSPVTASAAVPDVTPVQAGFISPNPVTAPAVVPTITVPRPLVLTPSAVAAPANVPAVGLSRGPIMLTPTAIACPASVPSISFSFGLATFTPSPVAASVVIPVINIDWAKRLTPTAVQTTANVPIPVIARGIVTLHPNPVVATAYVPVPEGLTGFATKIIRITGSRVALVAVTGRDDSLIDVGGSV